MGEGLRGKLGLALMGGAKLSKPLIQFSVDGGGCAPSLLFTWGQTMVEVMRIMVTSFKRSHAHTATLSVPDPAAGHCWPTPPLETPRHPQASPGQSPMGSRLFSPGSWCTRFYCALQESISQSCVRSGISMVGLMAISSKKAYSIPKSAAPRARPCGRPPLTQTSAGDAQTPFCLSPCVNKLCLSPLSISGGIQGGSLYFPLARAPL